MPDGGTTREGRRPEVKPVFTPALVLGLKENAVHLSDTTAGGTRHRDLLVFPLPLIYPLSMLEEGNGRVPETCPPYPGRSPRRHAGGSAEAARRSHSGAPRLYVPGRRRGGDRASRLPGARPTARAIAAALGWTCTEGDRALLLSTRPGSTSWPPSSAASTPGSWPSAASRPRPAAMDRLGDPRRDCPPLRRCPTSAAPRRG